MSEWDEYTGNDLSIECALDSRGAAGEIEHLRRYRAAYTKAEERIHARIDFVRNLVDNVASSPLEKDAKYRQIDLYTEQIEGLKIALIHLDRSLAEAMD